MLPDHTFVVVSMRSLVDGEATHITAVDGGGSDHPCNGLSL